MSDTDHDNAEPLEHRRPPSFIIVHAPASEPRVSPGCRAKCSPASPQFSPVSAAFIYAQTRAPRTRAPTNLFNRQPHTADGLAGLPRDWRPALSSARRVGDLAARSPARKIRGTCRTAHGGAGAGPEEQRRLAELEAARTRRVFFQAGPAATSAAVSPSIPGFADVGAGLQPGAQTTQDRQLAFLNAPVDRRTIAVDRIMAPASPYILQAGAVISAALITGIRSDLPGQITAQVTENTTIVRLAHPRHPAGDPHHRPVR